jgi:hypothetical protein
MIMGKYVVINTDGSNGFYDDIFHTVIPTGALSITNTDYEKFFVDNGKYRFVLSDGKAVLQEYVSIKTTADKLAALDAAYQPQFKDLAQSLGLATLDGNETVLTGIKADYATLKAEYQTKKDAINNGTN